MKRAILTGLLLGAVLACAGVAARDEALLPAMRLAWPGISMDIEQGIEAASPPPESVAYIRAETLRMTEALADGNRAAVFAADWPNLRLVAEAGIDDREARGLIGPGVAASLRERVAVFSDAWLKLGERL